MSSRAYLVVLLVCFPFIGFSQKYGEKLVDSLLKALPGYKEDTGKVNLLDDISYELSRIDPDKGISYGLQALKLAEHLKWEKGLARANASLGINYGAKSNFPKA